MRNYDTYLLIYIQVTEVTETFMTEEGETRTINGVSKRVEDKTRKTRHTSIHVTFRITGRGNKQDYKTETTCLHS